ncbi:porimin [Tenrec ecaudatus]|uniref:porimin n=1 Tax=Tenrec ecaudatus TaxID=94439 RepID=UPI003F5AB7A6
MSFGARGAGAALLLVLLQVPALLGAANQTGARGPDIPAATNLQTASSNSSTSPATTPVSPTTSKVTISSTSSNVSVTNSTVPSNTSARTTPASTKPAPQTSVSQNTSKIATSAVTTTHNSSVTSASSLVTSASTINSKENRGSKFDIGSFVGGIVLTLGVLSILYIGCKTYYSRRGIRYRTIDEHDAII